MDSGLVAAIAPPPPLGNPTLTAPAPGPHCAPLPPPPSPAAAAEPAAVPRSGSSDACADAGVGEGAPAGASGATHAGNPIAVEAGPAFGTASPTRCDLMSSVEVSSSVGGNDKSARGVKNAAAAAVPGTAG